MRVIIATLLGITAISYFGLHTLGLVSTRRVAVSGIDPTGTYKHKFRINVFDTFDPDYHHKINEFTKNLKDVRITDVTE